MVTSDIDKTSSRTSTDLLERETLLATESLTKRYAGFHALTNVNLTVKRGHIHSVIGPNGAGKTTLFGLLAGASAPSSGAIYFDGNVINRKNDARRVHLGISRSFQITTLFQRLSVFENLRLAAQAVTPSAMRFWTRSDRLGAAIETASTLMDQLKLNRYATMLAGELSHGQQRVLEVGMCLAAKPRILLLDEPTSGMGVSDLPVMRDLLVDVAQNHTVLLIEHNMNIVLGISNRITVMSRGSVLAEGTPAEIQGNDEVQKAYLGTGVLS